MLSALRALARAPRPWGFTPSLSTLVQPIPFRSLLRSFHASLPAAGTLNQSTRRKPPKKRNLSRAPLLENTPQKKGVVSHIFVMKPKKPNSAKRKVARVKLSNGKSLHAYIPGEGHNLQEHSVVLVRGGRAQDLPGVRCAVSDFALCCIP